MNLSFDLYSPENIENYRFHDEESSPISKKKVFEKTLKHSQRKNIQPVLRPDANKINFKAKIKQNECSHQMTVISQPRNLLGSSSPSKKQNGSVQLINFKPYTKSLKQCLFIQTVSENSLNSNSLQSSDELYKTTLFQPQQANSSLSSFHISLENPSDSQSFLTRSGNFHKSLHRVSEVSVKSNTFEWLGSTSSNHKKNNWTAQTKQQKEKKNLLIQSRVAQIKISPISVESDKKNNKEKTNFNSDLYNSKKNVMKIPSQKDQRITYSKNVTNSSFFEKEKQKQIQKKAKGLEISNLNRNYISIVEQINSQRSNAQSQSLPSEQPTFFPLKKFISFLTDSQKGANNSQITPQPKQQQRSFSNENAIRKLQGTFNSCFPSSYQSLSRISENFSEYECHTPRQKNIENICLYQNQNQIKFTTTLKKSQNPQFFNILKEDPHSYNRKNYQLQIVTDTKRTKENQNKADKLSGSKHSRRRSSKGIKVFSKQKNDSINNSENQVQRETVSKLKSLKEIKQMKRLRIQNDTNEG